MKHPEELPTPMKGGVGWWEQFRTFLYTLHADRGKERDYFVENLGMLVESGMPLHAAIGTLREEVASPYLIKRLDQLLQDVDAGVPLWRALDHMGMFRPHTISLVRIGEESGKLSANLKLIAIQEEKDRTLRGKIMGAMLYPLLVLSLTAGVGISIAWFILPRLATVFSQLDITLPTLTRYLIGSGQFLEAWGIVVFPVALVLLGIVLYVVFYHPSTKFIGQHVLFMVPGIGRLLKEVEISRFGYLLGTLLNAGLTATQSLDSLRVATEFPQYKKLYAHLHDSVEEGNSIQKSFGSYPGVTRLFPLSIVRLIGAGEQSGNLSEALIRISSVYEQKTENTAKNLTVLLEPILLVIVWGGVVMVALAVILPIYNLIGGFNSGTVEEAAPVSEVVETAEVLPQETMNQPLLDDGSGASPEVNAESGVAPSPVSQRGLGTLTILSTDLGYLNVRSGPGSTFEKIGEVLPGETHTYIGETDGWFEILFVAASPGGEESGWVSKTYVTSSAFENQE